MRKIEMESSNKLTNYVLNFSTYIGLIVIGLFIVYGYYVGIFASIETFKEFIASFGIWAPIVFILIQIVQVIIPILPGAAGCVVGIIIFGPWFGLLYNYIGICAGSIIVFLLSKRYGRQFVRGVMKEKSYEKYIGWISGGKKFERMFTYAIFFPFAPDDILCYIAGLTKMSLRKFVVIILLGKPMSIAVYSLGMTAVIQFLIAFIK